MKGKFVVLNFSEIRMIKIKFIKHACIILLFSNSTISIMFLFFATSFFFVDINPTKRIQYMHVSMCYTWSHDFSFILLCFWVDVFVFAFFYTSVMSWQFACRCLCVLSSSSYWNKVVAVSRPGCSDIRWHPDRVFRVFGFSGLPS